MRARRLTQPVFFALPALVLLLLAARPQSSALPGSSDQAGRTLFHHEASRLSMASVYAIDAYGPDAAALPRLAEAALDDVDRLDRLMSHYKSDSPLSRLNRDAASGPVAVDPELFDVIAEAIRYSRESDGAFDITVGPLMKAWGFFRGDGHVPGARTLAEARARVGYRHVRLNAANRTIAFDRAGVELDLGGIAKGYAVDRIVHILRRGGVTAALVSAGGSTLYALGAPPDRDGWPVEIQDPLDARKIALTLTLKDRALSVSGSAEKFFEADGVRYSHIMDPRTGWPVQGVLSVAVQTKTGIAGDALDNVLFVQGVEKSRATQRATPDLDDGFLDEAFFFLPAASPDKAGGWTLVRLRP